MSEQLPTLIGKGLPELEAAVIALGEPKFRANQLKQWLYEKRVADPNAMTNLSKALRDRLNESYSFITAAIARQEHDGENTTKFALRYPDGSVVETVLMFEIQADGSERRTLCVSTQAGCAMGCRFCASGQLGLKRNLSASEILEQVYIAAAHLGQERWLTNIVFMGMGEPLHNWEAFAQTLLVLTDPEFINMSPRRITVSTVGLANRIRDLAAMGTPVNLAVSLHAPNDKIRSELIPTNQAYGGIQGIVDACADYFEITRRQVTFEYTVVGGVNDRPEHAEELCRLIGERLPGSNVNLIPMNPVAGSGLHTPEERAVEAMSRILESKGHSVHTRKKKGRSISAACGQLRLQVEAASE